MTPPVKTSYPERELAGMCADALEQLEVRGGSARDLAERLGWELPKVRDTLDQLRRDIGPQRLRYSSVIATYWLEPKAAR
jgi:hypothetical protein